MVGRLRGSASVWLQSKGREWSSWSYDHFCTELRRHVQSNEMLQARNLMDLLHIGDLSKFNQEFTLLAAAAEETMGARWIRELYLQKVRPPQLAQLLRVRQEEPLQGLMSLAASLAPSFQRDDNRPGDRSFCQKC